MTMKARKIANPQLAIVDYRKPEAVLSAAPAQIEECDSDYNNPPAASVPAAAVMNSAQHARKKRKCRPAAGVDHI